MRPLSRALRIQEGEGRITALVVTLMFVAMAGMTIGESAMEALFFDRAGVDELPAMLVLQGGSTLVVMLALTAVLGRLGPRRAYLSAPLGLGIVLLAERFVLIRDVPWIYPVLWVTIGVATLVQGLFLWGIADSVVDVRQAKRLFPIFGAGGILGNVAGGLMTQPLASIMGTEDLLIVWVCGLALSFGLGKVVVGRGEVTRHRSKPGSGVRAPASGFAYLRRSRLATWMAVAALLLSLLFYLLYLPYARAATERFPDPDDLAGFFGLFWAAGTGAAFLVSILVTNRLLVRLGVTALVIVLPALYTAAFGVLLLGPGFFALVALRFVIGTWLQGAASPSWEAMCNAIPDERRDQFRTFLNGGAMQVGTMIAGVIALVGQGSVSLRQFSVIGLAAGALTLFATTLVRRSYIDALVDALRAGRPQVFARPAVPQTSIALAVNDEMARVLSGSARSPDVRERRLAFQLMAELPELKGPDEIADGVSDEDPMVRMAAIRGLDHSPHDAGPALFGLIHDPDPAVAAAAAARLIDTTGDTAPASRLRALLGDPDERIRRTAVEQLAFAPAECASSLAWGLLADPEASVRAAALERVVAAAPERGLEPALAALQDPDPLVNRAAGRALGRLSGQSLEHILEALDDPRTTVAAIEAVRTADVGSADPERIREFVRAAGTRAARDHELTCLIPREDDATALLHDAILDHGRRLALSGLWAATMLGPRRGEMEVAIENLDGSPRQVARALETLDTAGDPRLLRPLIGLWEPPPPIRPNGWLVRALEHEDALIRRCARFVHARGEVTAMSGSATALSVIERLLFLRKVPLFADLAPADLTRIAELVEESSFTPGELIAIEGDVGEDLHIVVEGSIRVVRRGERDRSPRELARRAVGDPVGEMSLLTDAPRMASLVAEGAVRTLRLGRREFESALRERPSVALALLRVLAQRLAEREDLPVEHSNAPP